MAAICTGTYSCTVRRHLRFIRGRARPTNCCFRSREAEAEKPMARIYGEPPQMSDRAPSKSLTTKSVHAFVFPIDYDPSLISVSECRPHNLTAHFSLEPEPEPEPEPEFLVSCYDKDRRQFFTAHSLALDGTISPSYYFYPPSPINKGWNFTGHSSNGILHLRGGNEEYLLWNPTTNEFKIIPKPLVPPPRVTNYFTTCGMWSDPSCQDIKVLQIVMAVLEDDEGECIEDSYEIDLYSLKSNSWKKIQCSGIDCVGRDGFCINGVFYTVVNAEGFDLSDRVILSFDFSTETLSTLRLPSYGKRPNILQVIEYRGMFSVLVGWMDKSGPWKRELWVMEEGDWKKETVFHTRGFWRPLCFSKNGELLYFASFDEEVMLFNRITGKLKHLNIHLWSDATRLFPFYASSVRLSEIADVKVHNIKQELDEEEEEEDGCMIGAFDGRMVQV